MAPFHHRWTLTIFLIVVAIISLVDRTKAGGYGTPSGFQATPWKLAHATFYGDETASATMGGACGYGNLISSGYGTDTVALSSVLYNKGCACGQCYQIKCVQSSSCYSTTVTVTATNLCPPNPSQDSNNGGWCNPPRTHFDMAKPAFMKIAQWKAGIVPVSYRRVPCVKKGGVKLSFQGNGYWLLVYVMNVGGSGDIASVFVKGTKTNWLPMSHNWGASYQAFATLSGQALSFKITSYTSHETIIANNVAPSNWQQLSRFILRFDLVTFYVSLVKEFPYNTGYRITNYVLVKLLSCVTRRSGVQALEAEMQVKAAYNTPLWSGPSPDLAHSGSFSAPGWPFYIDDVKNSNVIIAFS
ncbi:Expansin-A4 [Capsicum annuum]|uniref:Expansin n=1 Tax=Capsicum annuum TaxID=4072 RepID=A0A2G3APP4_CAPAN|nr:Expansin-A4 [Capsicum annuum]